jgi:myosin-crossreactive antigen
VQNALHHQHVHAEQAQRSTAAGASRLGKFSFISQFVEIESDVMFTVKYSVRATQMAVYELLGIERKIPSITPHDTSLRTKVEALIKAFT